MFSFVDLLHPCDELLLEIRADRVTILSFQLLDFTGSLINWNALGFSVAFFVQATGFPVTSSSLPVSDSEMSTFLIPIL